MQVNSSPSKPPAQPVVQAQPAASAVPTPLRLPQETTDIPVQSPDTPADFSIKLGKALLGMPFVGDFDEKYSLGRPLGGPSESPREALIRARYNPYLLGGEDIVILKRNDTYQAFEIDGPGYLRDNDLDNYVDARDITHFEDMPEDAEVFAVMADNKSFRYHHNQPGPAYARPAYPLPILSPDASDEVRMERLEGLQRDFADVASRLEAMAEDLGSTQDHRGIFTNLYNITTQAGQEEVQRLIDAGQLREAEFLCSLCIDFANRYFDAYDAYTHGDIEQVSEAWRNAFDLGRQAEDVGLVQGSVSKVLGLSIVAHIINDLPQTLQAVGYTDAPDRETTLRQTYDFFDAALMNQKEEIMGALQEHYGVSDTLVLDNIAEQLPLGLNELSQRELFAVMRDTARVRAETLSTEEIMDKATDLGDTVRRWMPGLT